MPKPSPGKEREAVDALVTWATSMGYKGDLSAVTAGLVDMPESIAVLMDVVLPSLKVLGPDRRDRALSVIIEATSHFAHVRDHADDALACLTQIREFIEDDSAWQVPLT